jgi:hypothetical protein
MCNTLEQDVKDFVLGKVQSGASFTAFDITEELGAAKHRYVKPIVHQMFADGEMAGYTRELDYSVNQSVPPFRYKPDVSATFVNHVTSGNAMADAQAACADDDADDDADDVVAVSVSGDSNANPNEGGKRLRIQKSVVDAVGFTVGQTVNAVAYHPIGSNLIEIYSTPVYTNLPTQQVVVDVRKNIRLNLDKLGVKGSKFSATVHGNVISVEVE